MWMLTFHVVVGYQGLLIWDFLWFFFFLVSFFSIQPTNPISGNASNAKWKKKRGMALRKKKIFQLVAFLLHLTVSLSQRSFETLFQHVKHCMTIFLSMKSATCNFTANSNTHLYKFGWTKLIFWYSHCPDLFVYTSSSLAFFLMQWVKSTVIFPSRPCFKFLCGQELFQQFLRVIHWWQCHLAF